MIRGACPDAGVVTTRRLMLDWKDLLVGGAHFIMYRTVHSICSPCYNAQQNYEGIKLQE
jgi:hypothetical protein